MKHWKIKHLTTKEQVIIQNESKRANCDVPTATQKSESES